MRDEKMYAQQDRGKINPGEFVVLVILLTVMTAVVISVIMDHIEKEIDSDKEVYLFLHGREDLREKAENALVAYGFLKENIIKASSEKIGKAGDYMAMLWKPPQPDHIKIQKITKVKATEPDKVFGLWKGVMRKDIDTAPLE
ncbi:MAG: hypothetical protein MRK02_11490 [Candidatus Scalindua sp.]|nr:hypothetical protein [Candidatus Scalindua sp.]